jgi:hypothetical protein
MGTLMSASTLIMAITGQCHHVESSPSTASMEMPPMTSTGTREIQGMTVVESTRQASREVGTLAVAGTRAVTGAAVATAKRH